MDYAYFHAMWTHVSSSVIGWLPIMFPRLSSTNGSSEQIIAQVSWSLPVITGSTWLIFSSWRPTNFAFWVVLRQQNVMDFFLEAKCWVADSAKSNPKDSLEVLLSFTGRWFIEIHRIRFQGEKDVRVLMGWKREMLKIDPLGRWIKRISGSIACLKWIQEKSRGKHKY